MAELKVILSKKNPVKVFNGELQEFKPVTLLMEGDSENSECWIWLMFFLADSGQEFGADEPWVRVTIDEAKKVRDRLDELIKQYGGAE